MKSFLHLISFFFSSAFSSFMYVMHIVNVGGDCPVINELYEFCQLSAGGSVAAAVKLNKQATEF